jgi:hypothetical protein
LVHDNWFDSELDGVLFIKSVPSETPTVSVVTGHFLLLSDCWFSGTESREVNSERIVIENCRFEAVEFPEIGMASQIGYDGKRTAPAATGVEQNVTSEQHRAVFTGFCIGAAGFAGVVMVARIAWARVRAWKLPQALR